MQLSPSLVPILSQIYPVHTTSFYLFTIHFNIIHLPTSLGEPGQLSWYSDWLRAGRPEGAGFRVPVGSKSFTSPHRPDRLWGPPNLL
jgi:hypothetical protein